MLVRQCYSHYRHYTPSGVRSKLGTIQVTLCKKNGTHKHNTWQIGQHFQLTTVLFLTLQTADHLPTHYTHQWHNACTHLIGHITLWPKCADANSWMVCNYVPSRAVPTKYFFTQFMPTKLLTPVYLSPSSIIWYWPRAVTLYGWQGNYGPGGK